MAGFPPCTPQIDVRQLQSTVVGFLDQNLQIAVRAGVGGPESEIRQ